jgi:hypothetical protein
LLIQLPKMRVDVNIYRLSRLLQNRIRENWRLCLIAWGVIALVLFCLSIISENGSAIYTFFPVMLWSSGSVLASVVYRQWTNFGRSTHILMLPASTLEKFLSVVLFVSLIFTLIFTLFYFLTAYLFINLYHPPVTLLELLKGGVGVSINCMDDYINAYLVLILLQALFLICAAAFRKNQFFIGVLVLVIVCLLYVYFQLFLLYELSGVLAFSHTWFGKSGAIDYYMVSEGKRLMLSIELTPAFKLINWIVWTLIGIGLYAVGFLKLQEREI